MSWLVGSSLFFYGWWNPVYVGLIILSILFNYSLGVLLGNRPSKPILVVGIASNLCLIGYFKYANFFVDNYNIIAHGNIHLKTIVLPLAISFFTFQQITYLIDAYRGLTLEYDLLHYCLFVIFFPQLVAGPIVHHKEMMPQFTAQNCGKIEVSHFAVGVTLFVLGLFKKVVIADNLAPIATPVFQAAEHCVTLTLFEAWGGALAYTFQLYFDFSGYSDMAIGLARMFGIILPVNFFSPYKAGSIIEFWRRWHITLSRFLRDYLYFPLGGNRRGKVRSYFNLTVTMLLGGLWHGAGWTYIIWGAMHGILLAINHAWITIFPHTACHIARQSCVRNAFFRILTFSAVVIAWVVFRAESLTGALNMYASMFGFNGISLPPGVCAKLGSLTMVNGLVEVTSDGMFHNYVFGDIRYGIMLLFISLLIVWFTPNSIEWLRREQPALGIDGFVSGKKSYFVWKFNVMFALLLALITLVCVFSMAAPSEFLYFQF